MAQGSARTEAKSAASKAFAHYLRTGRRLPDSAFESNTLITGVKFNQNHDPGNGQFTFGPGGSASLGGAASRSGRLSPQSAGSIMRQGTKRPETRPVSPGTVRSGTVSKKPADQPSHSGTANPAATPDMRDVDALSAQYETSRPRDAGTVSIPKGDRGGASYGPYQLSSNTGGVASFLAGPQGSRWAGEFKGLQPGSKDFSDKWRAIAKREPQSFLNAQKSYAVSTYFDGVAQKVAAHADYDLRSASIAVRQVSFSTAVQHGPSGGPSVIDEAIKRTDRKFKRSDPRYEAALINNIYDRRLEIFKASGEREKSAGDRAKANGDRAKAAGKAGVAKDYYEKAQKHYERADGDSNVVKNRLPDERNYAPLRLTILY